MREEGIDKIEVHVSGICFHKGKVLILKRSDSRKLYPGLWECGGGQVGEGENFEEAVVRQLEEEAGVIVDPIGIVSVYEIIDDEEKIPGIRFVCKIVRFVDGHEPVLSEEHSEWKWQGVSGLDEIELVPELKESIRHAYSIYNGKN